MFYVVSIDYEVSHCTSVHTQLISTVDSSVDTCRDTTDDFQSFTIDGCKLNFDFQFRYLGHMSDDDDIILYYVEKLPFDSLSVDFDIQDSQSISSMFS